MGSALMIENIVQSCQVLQTCSGEWESDCWEFMVCTISSAVRLAANDDRIWKEKYNP